MDELKRIRQKKLNLGFSDTQDRADNIWILRKVLLLKLKSLYYIYSFHDLLMKEDYIYYEYNVLLCA